ncbi:MAG: tetratricopeptide repeat protein [Chloroflexia bacterium]
MPQQSLDYRPRPPRGERSPTDRAARGETSRRPVSRAARRTGKRKRFLGSKLFWRLVAVVGLIVLVGSGVVVELTQTRQTDRPEDLPTLLELGNRAYEEGIASWQGGDTNRAAQMFSKASEYYARALALQPADADIRTYVAEALFYEGELRSNVELIQRAQEELQRALSDAPDKPEALLLLGYVLQSLGDAEGARAAWQRVVQVAPGTAQAEEAQQRLEQYGER